MFKFHSSVKILLLNINPSELSSVFSSLVDSCLHLSSTRSAGTDFLTSATDSAAATRGENLQDRLDVIT